MRISCIEHALIRLETDLGLSSIGIQSSILVHQRIILNSGERRPAEESLKFVYTDILTRDSVLSIEVLARIRNQGEYPILC